MTMTGQIGTTRLRHIVVMDHDGDIRDVVRELLLTLGHRVSVAADSAALIALLDRDGVDLIVLDASTSNAPGLDVALDARQRGIRLVMISGHPDLMERFQNRADQLLWKPFGRDQLERAVNHALASDVRGQRIEDPD